MKDLIKFVKIAVRNLIDSGRVSKMSAIDDDCGFRSQTISDMLNSNDNRKELRLAEFQILLKYIKEKDCDEFIKLIHNITGIDDLVLRDKCEWKLYERIGKIIDMGL